MEIYSCKNLIILISEKVFSVEVDELNKVSLKLTSSYSGATDEIIRSQGRTIVCGIGKSGIIKKKPLPLW